MCSWRLHQPGGGHENRRNGGLHQPEGGHENRRNGRLHQPGGGHENRRNARPHQPEGETENRRNERLHQPEGGHEDRRMENRGCTDDCPRICPGRMTLMRLGDDDHSRRRRPWMSSARRRLCGNLKECRFSNKSWRFLDSVSEIAADSGAVLAAS